MDFLCFGLSKPVWKWNKSFLVGGCYNRQHLLDSHHFSLFLTCFRKFTYQLSGLCYFYAMFHAFCKLALFSWWLWTSLLRALVIICSGCFNGYLFLEHFLKNTDCFQSTFSLLRLLVGLSSFFDVFRYKFFGTSFGIDTCGCSWFLFELRSGKLGKRKASRLCRWWSMDGGS